MFRSVIVQPMDWLDGKGLRKSVIGKLVRKTSGQEYVDRSPQMSKECENIYDPCSSKAYFNRGKIQ